MKIEPLLSAPDACLTAALAEFERRFLYPLGERQRFRIAHGADYRAFFQAMGEARVLMAVRRGGQSVNQLGTKVAKQTNEAGDPEEVVSILGTLAYVRRHLLFRTQGADSAAQALESHYFCDLKVRPEARGVPALAGLIAAAKAEIEPGPLHACHAIVMDGTERPPLAYTGRLGVPQFQKLGEIMILRLPALHPRPETHPSGGTIRDVSNADVRDIQRRLAPSGFLLTGGDSSLRSIMPPRPLADAEGLASGTVEDTRKAKRLLTEDSGEILSAHLSGFVSTSPARGAALLRQALAVALEAGLPALFVSMPRVEAGALLTELNDPEITLAPATVFGHALPAGHDWRVDTAEI
ncbi:MAG: hypothetical protein JWM59_4166 [Verrucomicrobiales bacterium]|nr:hypothetical protein [Verrucomicrobiales bacterium]